MAHNNDIGMFRRTMIWTDSTDKVCDPPFHRVFMMASEASIAYGVCSRFSRYYTSSNSAVVL